MAQTSLVRRFAPLALIAAVLAVAFAGGLERYLSFAALAEHRSDLLDWAEARPAAAAAAYVAAYVLVVACSLPGGTVATLAGGFLFGALWGGFFAVIGATVGATLLFLAARSAMGDFLRAKAGPAVAAFEAGFRENALSYMLVLRLVPAFPFFLVNLAPAFLGVRLGVYVVATFLGILPATFVFASIGAGLGSVFDHGEEPDLSLFMEPSVILPLLGLAVLSLLPVAYKKFKGRKAP